MIIGHIANLEKELYKLPEAIKKALLFIQEKDCANLKPGKYEIDGDQIFVLVQKYMSKEKMECGAETHAKYIDIQYVAKGEEYMGYCALNPQLEVEEDCLAERDAKFYTGLLPESDVILSEGMYAILYPNDVHRPCCMVEKPVEVIKLVAKVSVDA